MDKTKLITRITVFCSIILLKCLNAVYTCTTTAREYAKNGENVILHFQAVTTNSAIPAFYAVNIIQSPNSSSLLTILYKDGSTPTPNPTCNGCNFVGDTNTGDISVRIDNLKTANVGTYRHSAQGQAEDIKCITVYILGIPAKPTITSDKNNVVGFDTKLTCSSKSTTQPTTSNLNLQYTWNIDNPDENRYEYSQYKDTLTIKNLMKTDFKNFTCRATESGNGIVGETSLSSNMFALIFIYGPDTETTTLSPASLLYIKKEGDSLDDITCNSDCFPSCTYIWTKSDSSLMVNSRTLSLPHLTRAENAKFTCTVINTNRTEMTIAKTVTVIVRYISFFVNGSEGQNEIAVNEYNDVHFTCLISEWESTIRIMFQDDTLKKQIQTKSLTFTRNSITCLHAGTYTCDGYDPHGKVSSAPIKLLVRCSPRPLRHAYNNFTSSLYGSVTLSFTTLAYPEPGSSGFLWHKEDGIRWIALLSNTDLLISSSGLNSNLTIMNVSLQDFGQYRVTVTNDIGSYEHYLFLVEKGEHKQQMATYNCPLDRDETGLIVGISFGIVSAVLTVYSTIVTIALKRNRTNRGTKIKEGSTTQRTYINIAEEGTGRDTIGSGENKDNSIEMYTDLARSSLDDKTTYDVIQGHNAEK